MVLGADVTWWSPAGISGIGLALMAAVVAFLLVLGFGEHRRPLLATAVGGVTFQVIHFIEHLAQLGYWFGNTDKAPWLTPWAAVARDGLAFWCQVIPGKGVDTARGNEVLHLVGNVLFMAGAVALALFISRRALRGGRPMSLCLWIQGFHVVEHVLLTVSLFTTGKARGFSTGFGLLDPTTEGAIAYRVLFHFLINLAATVYAVAAATAAARSARAGAAGPDGLDVEVPDSVRPLARS